MTGPNRKLAEQYGLWIWCCDYHHLDPKEGVQYNRAKADSLKRLAQIAFEARHSREEWMRIFRKNYLDVITKYETRRTDNELHL